MDLIECFPYWADMRGFRPCNLAGLQQPLFWAGGVARSKGKEPLFLGSVIPARDLR